MSEDIEFIVIENRTVIPVESRKYDAASLTVVQLYDITTKITIGEEISFIRAGTFLYVHVEGNREWLEMCRKDGVCGLCNAEIDPKVELPAGNQIFQKDFSCCAYCGKKLKKNKSTTLVDMFNFLTQNDKVSLN